MHIALATCSSVPAHEHDDLPLEAALRERGIEFGQPQWDDATVDWAGFDAVVLRTIWDYHDKGEAFARWIERVRTQTQLLNPAPIVAWNSHKYYLRELEAEGVAVAPSVWFEPGQRHDLSASIRALGCARGFLKPVLGANSKHTVRFDAREPEAVAAAQRELDTLVASEAMLLQPYLESVETEGEFSLILFDGVFSHGVRKVPVAGDYRVQDDWGAHDEAWEPDAAALALCERTLSALETIANTRGWDSSFPLLYARVDLLRDARSAWVLNELELIEPSLFFRHGPQAAEAMAEAISKRLGRALDTA